MKSGSRPITCWTSDAARCRLWRCGYEKSWSCCQKARCATPLAKAASTLSTLGSKLQPQPCKTGGKGAVQPVHRPFAVQKVLPAPRRQCGIAQKDHKGHQRKAQPQLEQQADRAACRDELRDESYKEQRQFRVKDIKHHPAPDQRPTRLRR